MKDRRNLRFFISFLALGVLVVIVYGGQDLLKSLAGTQSLFLPQAVVPLATTNGAATTTDAVASVNIISSTTASSSDIVMASETISTVVPTFIATSILTSVVSTPTSTATPASSVSENLPYSIGPLMANGFAGNDGWIEWWGNFLQANGDLIVGANASSTGGGTLFTESSGWNNYTFQASVDWIKGESFGLVARYEGDKNYVICNFGEVSTGTVYMNLRQFVNGEETDLAQGSISNYNGIGGMNIPVAIEVQGNQGICGFDGHAISATITNTAATSTQAGDIGFSTWDPALNNSEIIVHSIDVEGGVYNLQTSGAQTIASSSIPAPASTPTQLAELALPYSETDFTGDANWDADWGASAIDSSSNALIIESASTTTGANVILDHSMSWTNYQFDTTVDWVKGEVFSLMARYVDGNDYVACQFYQPDSGVLEINLEQFVNGRQINLANSFISDYTPSANPFSNASIKVNNTEGVCTFDNYYISNQGTNSYLINAPYSGGIGFTTWDPAMNNTELIVKSVSVGQAAN